MYNDINIRLIPIIVKKDNVTKLYCTSDGTLHLSEDYVKCTENTIPIFLYKTRLLETTCSPIGPCIYKYQSIDGRYHYVKSLYDINGLFIDRYLILKTNETGLSDELVYVDDLVYDKDELLQCINMYHNQCTKN